MRIFICGDSTAASYNPEETPMVGWGQTNESKAVMGTKPDGTLTFTTGDQFTHEDASLQRFTKTHSIRDEDPLFRTFQTALCRFQLIGHKVHGRFVTNM